MLMATGHEHPENGWERRLAPGYGRLNDAVREAMAMAARHEGLLLDPVYTPKTMAGLVAHVRAGRIARGNRVLFVHTGGQPALFAYADSLGSWLSEAPAPRPHAPTSSDVGT